MDWGSEIRAWGMSWSRQTLIKQDSSGVIGGESALGGWRASSGVESVVVVVR